MSTPLVSVIIPTYNRASTIENAIRSALNQSCSDIEVLVIDDASSDHTQEVVFKISDRRIRYFKNLKNMGANVSRNRGISEAKGEYIAFLDSADDWDTDKIRKQLQCIQSDPESVDIVFCAERVHTEKDCYTIPNQSQKQLLGMGKLKEVLAKENCIDTSTIFLKKTCFDKVGMFDAELPRLQEYEWLLRAVQKCQIRYLDECLVDAYIRKDSISADVDKLVRTVPLIYKNHHGFFAEYDRTVDFLFIPVKKLHQMEVPFSSYETYFELLYGSLDVSCHADVWRMQQRFCRQLYGDSVRNKLKYQNRKSGYYLSAMIEKRIKFNVFGAGKIAKELYTYLKQIQEEDLIENLIVTSVENNQSVHEKIPLLELRECGAAVKHAPVLLAIDENNMSEVIDSLKERNFENIIILSSDELC